MKPLVLLVAVVGFIYLLWVNATGERRLEDLALNHTTIRECNYTPDSSIQKASTLIEYTRPTFAIPGEFLVIKVNFLDSDGQIFAKETIEFNFVDGGVTAAGMAVTANSPPAGGPIICEIVGSG